MPAELETHRRQDLIREISFASRTEPLKQRCAQDRHRNTFFNRRIDGPTSLTRIRNASGKTFQPRTLRQRDCRQIQQPRSDDTAAPPNLSDVREIEIVLVVLGIS